MKRLDHACNGECGATEEQFLEYDPEDVVDLFIKGDTEFSSKDHYPIISGCAADGTRLYLATISHDDLYFRAAVPSGITLSKLRFKCHYSDKTQKIFEPDNSTEMYVTALKYDPDAYARSEYYVRRFGELYGVNPTGPFSWVSHRKLEHTDSREYTASLAKTSIFGPDLLWVELLMK